MPDAKTRCMQAREVRQRCRDGLAEIAWQCRDSLAEIAWQCRDGLARPQQVSRHLQAIYARPQPWPGTRMHDVPERARTVSWALLLCVST